MAKKKRNFEQSMDRLAEIIEIISNGDVELEKSVELYKEGIDLAVFCGESLKAVEDKIMLLKKEADGAFSEKPLEECNAISN